MQVLAGDKGGHGRQTGNPVAGRLIDPEQAEELQRKGTMFTAKIIAFFFISVAILIPAMIHVDTKKHLVITAILTFISIAGLYFVAAGLFLATGWQDPFSSASTEQVARISAIHGGRGGIVLLAIRFWPYGLAAIGAYLSHFGLSILWNRKFGG
ncbi:MAG: hypothetical protein M0036_14105 [Desulfobacteraceae bacterium]|nr:hypothetical protein [Desulfobacteraceae bacterium]